MPTLDWLTRGEDIKAANRVPYRLLEADPALSVGDADSGNMLIQGDNLEALKSLLPYYAGQVKCIYIDPPYNTRSAFEHYDDNLEHSQWLAMMWPRLELLRDLLHRSDGVIAISLNDDEVHYAKVICDEVFGRSNFVRNLIWNYEGNTDNQSQIINYHEHILIYCNGQIKTRGVVDPNIVEGSKLFNEEIRNTIVKNGPKNPISSVTLPHGFPCSFEGTLGRRGSLWPKFSGHIESKGGKLENAVVAESGWSSKNILLNFIEAGFQPVADSKGQLTRMELTRSGSIEAVKVRQQDKGHFISVLRGFGTTNQMRLMLEKIGLKFTFPKPLGLIEYLIRAFTDENDYVLDSFAGSGTTGHATLLSNLQTAGNRKFILVEQNENTARQITRPRLQMAIQGNSEADLPSLGGGFAFYRLGDEVFDAEGRIRAGIVFAGLAAHVWFSETGNPLPAPQPAGPFLGVHDARGFALLYNGVLGDKRPQGGNVLTNATLALIREAADGFGGPMTVYGEASRLSEARLREEAITFKQTPYDVKAR